MAASRAFAYDLGDEELGRLMKALARKQEKRSALESLCVAVDENAGRSQATLREMLPSWMFLFAELLLDNDYRVRAGAHTVMGQLASRVRKAVGRQSGDVAGVWFCGCFDPSAEVAAEAKSALAQLLPDDEKRATWLQNPDILDNVMRYMGAPAFPAGDEDREQRKRISVLGALAELVRLTSLFPGLAEGAHRAVRKIVRSSDWKAYLATSRDPPTRLAAIHLIAGLVECKTSALHQQDNVLGLKVLKLLLSSLQLNSSVDTKVVREAWGAVVALLNSEPMLWQSINIRKTLLPRVRASIASAKRFQGSSVFPFLSELLKSAPDSIWQEHLSDSRVILDALWERFDDVGRLGPEDVRVLAKSCAASLAVIAQRSECVAVAQAADRIESWSRKDAERVRAFEFLTACASFETLSSSLKLFDALISCVQRLCGDRNELKKCLSAMIKLDEEKVNRAQRCAFERLTACIDGGQWDAQQRTSSLEFVNCFNIEQCSDLALDFVDTCAAFASAETKDEMALILRCAQTLGNERAKKVASRAMDNLCKCLDEDVNIDSLRRLRMLQFAVDCDVDVRCSTCAVNLAGALADSLNGEAWEELPLLLQWIGAQSDDIADSVALKALKSIRKCIETGAKGSVARALEFTCRCPTRVQQSAVARDLCLFCADRIDGHDLEDLFFLIKLADPETGRKIASRAIHALRACTGNNRLRAAEFLSECTAHGLLLEGLPSFLHAFSDQASEEELALLRSACNADLLKSSCLSYLEGGAAMHLKDVNVVATVAIKSCALKPVEIVDVFCDCIFCNKNSKWLLSFCESVASLKSVSSVWLDALRKFSGDLLVIDDSDVENARKMLRASRVVGDEAMVAAETPAAGNAATASENIDESSADASPEPSFAVGDLIYYAHRVHGNCRGKIVKVHTDDAAHGLYYTIKYRRPNGGDDAEVQTTPSRLQRRSATTESSHDPKTLAELQRMLAKARRERNHKESVRLLKLQPTLVPKPKVSQTKIKPRAVLQPKAHMALFASASKTPQERLRFLNPKLDAGSLEDEDLEKAAGLGLFSLLHQHGNVSRDILFASIVSFFECVPGDACGEFEIAGVAISRAAVACFSDKVLCASLPKPMQSNFCRALLSCTRNHALPQVVSAALEALSVLGTAAHAPLFWNVNSDLREALASECLRATEAGVCLEAWSSHFASTVEWYEHHGDHDWANVWKLTSALGGEGVAAPCAAFHALARAVQVEARLHPLTASLDHPLIDALAADADDAHSSIALLLIWLLNLNLISAQSGRGVKSKLIEWLHERRISSRVLARCCGLVGLAGFGSSSAPLPLFDDDLLKAGGDFSFIELLATLVLDRALLHLSMHVLRRTSTVLPGLVKAWWSEELNRAQTASTSKFAAKHITPHVLKVNVDDIKCRTWIVSGDDSSSGSFSAKGSAAGRTITCCYGVDEASIEMFIRFPAEFPLKNVQVECSKHLGVKQNKWRRWVLQLVNLFGKNGSAVEAVDLWKQNLDCEFAGMEPCPICYSVLNIDDHSVPKLKCSTCANKYHSSCLYTWFRKSHKNECPMCKQPFSS